MGTKLKEIRMAKGISQSQLAEASGVSLRAIQSYEQGRRPISGASYDTLKALADALEVTIEKIVIIEFFGG